MSIRYTLRHGTQAEMTKENLKEYELAITEDTEQIYVRGTGEPKDIVGTAVAGTINQYLPTLQGLVDSANEGVDSTLASASEALASAESASASADTATTKTAEVVSSGNTALSNIESARTGALSNIDTAESDALLAIQKQQTSSVGAVESQQDTSVLAVQTQQGTSVGAVQSAQSIAENALDILVNTATTKANEASASASTATTKANEASISADNASGSEGIASSKALEASGYADSASASAGVASTQAGTATTQAGIATTKAGEASTSAGNASTSASNASTYATNAQNSALLAQQYAGSIDPEAYALTLHDHTVADITDFPALADVATSGSYNDLSDLPTIVDTTWNNVSGKPDTYPPSSHTHVKADISDFPTSLPANGGDADTVDGLHASSLFQLGTFTEDANTMLSNRSGFSYASNCPHYGPIVKFGINGYDLQLNALYWGGQMSFRTKNGDNGTWNGWKQIATVDQIPTTLPASDVSAWAKASTKPNYTASEVGASSSSHSHVGTYEPVLGNPSSNGMVLQSTTAGVRSWVTSSSVPHGSQFFDGMVSVGFSNIVLSPQVYINATASVGATVVNMRSSGSNTIYAGCKVKFYGHETIYTITATLSLGNNATGNMSITPALTTAVSSNRGATFCITEDVTYQFTVPNGVSRVYLTGCGGGAGGGNPDSGGHGQCAIKTPIDVVSGATYTITVGRGGIGYQSALASYVVSPTAGGATSFGALFTLSGGSLNSVNGGYPNKVFTEAIRSDALRDSTAFGWGVGGVSTAEEISYYGRHGSSGFLLVEW